MSSSSVLLKHIPSLYITFFDVMLCWRKITSDEFSLPITKAQRRRRRGGGGVSIKVLGANYKEFQDKGTAGSRRDYTSGKADSTKKYDRRKGTMKVQGATATTFTAELVACFDEKTWSYPEIIQAIG